MVWRGFRGVIIHIAYYWYVTGGLKNFHRADFQKSLLNKLPATYTTHLSSRLISYSEGQDSVCLEFENGSTADCHILVGADGIKSAVRNKLLKDLANKSPVDSNTIKVSTDTVWTGTSVYRGFVQSDHLAARFPNHRTLTTPTMVCNVPSSIFITHSFRLFTPSVLR